MTPPQQMAPPHEVGGLIAPPPPWEIWLMSGIALVVFATFALWAWKKWRSRDAYESKPSQPKKDVVAEMILELEKLTPEDPFNHQERTEFFFKLTSRLKFFLELKTKIPLSDMTLNEVVVAWDGVDVGLSQEEKGQALEFLKEADLVKFAKVEVGVVQAERLRDNVVGWLREVDGRMLR